MDHDTLRMHAGARDKWCDMLADTTLLQVTGKLYGEAKMIDRTNAPGGAAVNQYGYCCLGVLARSQGASFEFETVTETDEDGHETEVEADEATVELPTRPGQDINDNEMLDEGFAESVGLTTNHQGFLSTLNDGGETTVAKASLFFPLYQKYCESESAPRLGNSDSLRLFKMRKHTFAEIRAIILVEF